MWLLYQAAVVLGLVLGGPILLLARGRHYLSSLAGRLALDLPTPSRPSPLWIHAVSVGEVAVAATLAKALPADLPLLVTTITPTGQARARALFSGRADVAYLPFELGFAVRRFLRHFAPRALVLVEGDYWPLLLRHAERRAIPALVVNGRLSDRSFPRLLRLRRWLGPLFRPIRRFGVQSPVDRERLRRLGVEEARIAVTGNLKYETPPPPATPVLDELLTQLAAGRPILVAGSTMAGEEGLVLEAFLAAGGGAAALLVLAPRHPERFAEAAADVARRGLSLVRRSQARPGATLRPAVVVLDSLGELASAYRLAAGAFIGGTLVPKGGHNPLEAARWGTPVVVGPSLENFREIADHFDRAAAWERVADGAGLARTWQRWLADPEAARPIGARGRGLIETHRGALARTLELLATLGSPPEPARMPATTSAGGA